MNAVAQAIPGQQETALLDHVQRLSKSTAGRRALHLRLSLLRPANRQARRLHIAAVALDPLINAAEGSLFRLQNDDFVILCKDASPEAISDAVSDVAALFVGDPAVEGVEKPTTEFFQNYDLAASYTRFVSVIRGLLEAAIAEAEAGQGATPAQGETAFKRILDPKTLGSMQAAIARADLSNVIRRQVVCAVLPGHPPKPVFSEVFTSMAALREILTPGIDIHGNPWLFRDLTAHLDRRVLSFLGHKDDSTLSKAFSINMNVASLAAQEFLNFDQRLSNEARETVVIELQLVDIMSDLDSFLFSRNFLRSRKYRFCLDGLTHQTLPLINSERLGFDLVKIIWSPELHEQAVAKEPGLMLAVKAIGAKRIILIRCDDEVAFETGKLLGSSLYQGFLIDKLLKGSAAKTKAPPAAKPQAKPPANPTEKPQANPTEKPPAPPAQPAEA